MKPSAECTRSVNCTGRCVSSSILATKTEREMRRSSTPWPLSFLAGSPQLARTASEAKVNRDREGFEANEEHENAAGVYIVSVAGMRMHIEITHLVLTIRAAWL